MSLERVLQISMAVLASLATLLLGMGEGNALLPILAIVVAASSIYFVDIRRWIYLNTPMANLGGLVAVVISLWDYRQVNQEEHQLVALANLLIYLQCVLLYRIKTPRIYWMLALLSLLQVAVATVMNLTFWFGVLLVIYMLLAMVTLMLFLIHREQSQYAPGTQGESFGVHAFNGRAVNFQPRSFSNASGKVIRRGVLRQVSRMAAATLALTAAVFVIVPRTSGTTWGEKIVETQHVVGFSDTVTLGELGEIVENPEEVLQVRFFDNDTGEPYQLQGVPLFRGTVVTQYQGSRWSMGKLMFPKNIPTAESKRRGLVKQEFQVSRLDTRTLFALYPIFRDGHQRDRIVFDSYNYRITRGQGPYKYPLRYSLLTNSLRDGYQLDIVPCYVRPNPHQYYFRLLSRVDRTRLRGLSQMAAEVVADIPYDQMVARATALDRYLRDFGGYRYTLTPPKRNPKRDPIEEFVVTNRQGHCEYFASALTLMLRSVGIPARMAIGFKGADWNPLTGYYHVRQLHAHTWVEVYLPPEQVPDKVKQANADFIPEEDWNNGAWLTLDPTPAFEGSEVMPPASRFPTIRHMMDYADYLWAGYVLSMDSRRQRESIFEPVKRATQGIVAVLTDREMWTKTLWNLWRIIKGEKLDDTGLWFSWRAAVVTFVFLTLLVFLYRGVAWFVRRFFRWGDQRHSLAGNLRDAEVEFYRRLEELLASQALRRSASQTQREFARQAGDRLAQDPQTVHVAAVPRKVAEFFYRVRFGREHLEPAQAEAIEHSLAELSAALSETQQPAAS